MSINKKIVLSLILLLFVFLGFGSGYLAGKIINSTKKASQTPQAPDIATEIYRPQPTTENTPIVTSQPVIPYYLLKNENDVLSLYEITGEEKTLIKTININSVFLPSEDREKLKKGIAVASLEEGYELIEDFTS